MFLSPGANLEDLNLDPFDGSKSRKSSGFSETTNKSRQCSGYDVHSKSRNSSGSNPVMASSGKLSPPGCSPLMQTTSSLLHEETALGGLGVNQLGLFDLTGSNGHAPTSASTAVTMKEKDLEIARLKEELAQVRMREESVLMQARQACEAWKKEAAIALKKVEMAQKDKDGALTKVAQLQKELESATCGGPYLHAVKRVAELKGLPAAMLKSLDWQLRKDLQEVEKVREHPY
jgi:hypothetical protein